MPERAKLQTEYWLKRFIIGYNICPFSHTVVAENRLFYAVDTASDTVNCLRQLITECQRLDADDKIETTLVIYVDNFNEFDCFLDYVALADELLVAQGYEGIYQLASFHPDYCFADADENDAANYTNRSPFPMLHLIREASIEKALRSFSDPASIPAKNIEFTRSLGLSRLKALLAAAKMLCDSEPGG